jgi:hypothetical protein
MYYEFLLCNAQRITMYIIFMCSFNVHSSYGTEQNQSFVPAKKLTIVRGVGSYPPLEMVENGHLTGLYIDMIRQSPIR